MVGRCVGVWRLLNVCWHERSYLPTPAQVLSNSFTALVASTLWSILFAPDSVHSWFYTTFVKPSLDLGHLTLNPSERIYSPVNWCAVDRSVSQDWSRKLVFVALG